MIQRVAFFVFAMVIITACDNRDNPPSSVVREGGKTFIVDRTGYKWDITQAESIGYKPDRFQYGMGKDAFSPLDASGLSDDKKDVPDDLRIIGIEEGANAQAYSVQKLRSHEVANSALGSSPVAVGY